MSSNDNINYDPIFGLRRPRKLLDYEVVREMTDEDVERLSAPERQTTNKDVSVKKINARHRAAARAIASGESLKDAAISANLTPERVHYLTKMPAFQELVAYYTTERDIIHSDYQAKLAQVGEMALDEIGDRLEHAPEDFKNRELLDIIQSMSDRTGHGPQATNVNFNGSIADTMEKSLERVRQARKNKDGSYDV